MPNPDLTTYPFPDLITAQLWKGNLGLYLHEDDLIRFSAFSSLSSLNVQLQGLMLTQEGALIPLQLELQPASNRSEASITRGMGAGWLLHLACQVSGATVRRGQCYVTARVFLNSVTIGQQTLTLMQDYVYTAYTPTWPGHRLIESIDGQGALRVTTGTNPAIATEISETVPTGARWKLHSFFATLSTDANVGNRTPTIILDDGANIFYRQQVATAITAGQNSAVTWATSGAVGSSSTAAAFGFLPAPCILGAGYRIRTVTVGMQVGDDWTAPQYEVEEFLEP